MYGLPDYCEELQSALKDGRIVLGGCMVDHDSPIWHCNDCGHEWGRAPEAKEEDDVQPIDDNTGICSWEGGGK